MTAKDGPGGPSGAFGFCTPAKGDTKVFVTVSVRGLPPRFSFPIEVSAPDSQKVIVELKDFLIARGYSTRFEWQQHVR